MVHNTRSNRQEKNNAVYEYLYNEPLPIDENGNKLEVGLATVSERDSVWDTHRNQASIVDLMYSYESEFERYSERIGDCSGYLKFGIGEQGLVLKQAYFCRVRYCPVCQWRKSLFWKAMIYKTYPTLREQYPTHRWLFLTLTIKNPPIGELRATLDDMNKSWKKLTKRKEFALVDGWIRTTEVTRDSKNPNTHCHPHFHVILMVKPSYFGKGYIKQMAWVELWRSCLGVDYLPNVDIRTVKAKSDDDFLIQSAIAETLKYSTKPSDMIQDCDDPLSREWFYELTRQTHKLRFVATGGALKDVLKSEDKIENQEMITTGNDDETQETDERRLNFTYYSNRGKYIYNPKFNE